MQTVTILFTDLVGSTELASRLGPSATEELRHVHFSLLRSAIESSSGTEVKNLGDGLMVAFAGLSDALGCATGMQQAIERHNRREPDSELAVRIGISTGEATEEDGDYFGDPVVEAARLCNLAQGGQILATQVVKLLAGRHAAETFVDVGALELKGIPEPVETVEVIWSPETIAGSVALPRRLSDAAAEGLSGFVGRTVELARLDDATKAAHAERRCRVVFVSGEAGMGKTTLVARFAAAFHATGATVVLGHTEEDLGIAYQPWVEALTYLVREGDPRWTDDLRSAQRTALTRLVPELAGSADRVADPDTERLLLFEGAVELLSIASAEAPLLVVLDDVHWADAATLQLLRHVVTTSVPMDVTIACTHRDTDLSRGDPLTKLLADMRRESAVTRVELAGLADTDVIDLVSKAAGHELDGDGLDLAHVLRRETGGNPFFTGELLRHLAGTGGLVLGDDGRWSLAGEVEDLGMPSSVRDVVGRRVERLGHDAPRILGLASVIGNEFDLEVLELVADIDEDVLLDLADAAVAASMLTEAERPGRYRFVHALTRHTLYDELSPARRQRAHRRVAETLEARPGEPSAGRLGELARHWVAATRPADAAKALDYVTRAGDAAQAALAPDEAIRWYEQALELLENHDEPNEMSRCELLISLGAAQSQMADPAALETLETAAALADRLDAVDLLVAAALAHSLNADGGLVAGAERPASIAVIQRALERIGSAPTGRRAKLLRLLAEAQGSAPEHWDNRREICEEAMQIARDGDDDATFVLVCSLVQAIATPDRLGEMAEDITRAVAIADRLEDPILRLEAQYQLLWLSYQRADLPGADAAIAEIAQLADAIGLPRQQFFHLAIHPGRLLLAGDAEAAEAANDLILGFDDTGAIYGGILGTIRRHQGRLAEIADVMVELARDNPSLTVLSPTASTALSEIGRIDEARQRVDADFTAGFPYPPDATWASSMMNIGDAAVNVGHHDCATAVFEALSPFADQIVTPTPSAVGGSTARVLARLATMLGDFDHAEELFATAHDLHARLEAPYWTARGKLDHADLCLARGDVDDTARAAQFVADALTLARQFGCAGLIRRAEELGEPRH